MFILQFCYWQRKKKPGCIFHERWSVKIIISGFEFLLHLCSNSINSWSQETQAFISSGHWCTWSVWFFSLGSFVFLAGTKQSLWLSKAIIVLDIFKCTRSQTLLNGANFPNGTVIRPRHSLAASSGVVKGCVVDQVVPSVSISIRPSWLERCRATGRLPRLSQQRLCFCQCYSLCACVSFVIMLDEKKCFVWLVCA